MKKDTGQDRLFEVNLSLPSDYEPIRPDYLKVSQIYLAKGSIITPERRQYVERIIKLYPEAKVTECLDTPHNRINLYETDALALHRKGKQTLVFGELKNAVRYSEEEGNTCPNYWHFSPYGYCPYGCKYCYLAGTQGVKFSPTIKIYVNLPEMLAEIDQVSRRLQKPTAFYIGKLQDALALEPLTAFSTIMIPFFADHPFARLTLLTKSPNVDRLIGLEHQSHTILSWSVNPPEVCQTFEENAPSIGERLQVMRLVTSAGYPLRAVMMPIIPIKGWQEAYAVFTRHLVETVPLKRLTIGGICSYKAAHLLMERKLGINNAVSTNLGYNNSSPDGRARYLAPMRQEIYSHIIKVAHDIRPDMEIALCLEEKELWQKCGLENNLGRCNCVW
jgi:spore photoproduct lyase